MLSISRAQSDEDFEIVRSLIGMLAAWDMEQSKNHGISETDLLETYYSIPPEDLDKQFDGRNAVMLLARWKNTGAGCIAFSYVDHETVEILRFFVDPTFRGKGVGLQLLRTALDEIDSAYSRVRLATAVFMTQAIALYEAEGFMRVQPFHDTPASLAAIDIYMERLRPTGPIAENL